MIETAAFVVLGWVLLWHAPTVDALRARTPSDWTLDLVGLAVQGVLVPIAQVTAVAAMLAAAGVPRGTVALPTWAAFLLAFVAVDYLYYWNHRLLHTGLWPLHKVHHSAPAMDLFVTSRNTVWTSACIVYLWAGALAWWLLEDPSGYLAGATLTAVLDLWRHTPLDPPRAWRPALGWMILPSDHARHHADDAPRGNFGANLKVWDLLHGTALVPEPTRPLGLAHGLSLRRALWWPR